MAPPLVTSQYCANPWQRRSVPQLKQGAGADSVRCHRPLVQRSKLQNWQTSVHGPPHVAPSTVQAAFSVAVAHVELPPPPPPPEAPPLPAPPPAPPWPVLPAVAVPP